MHKDVNGVAAWKKHLSRQTVKRLAAKRAARRTRRAQRRAQ